MREGKPPGAPLEFLKPLFAKFNAARRGIKGEARSFASAFVGSIPGAFWPKDGIPAFRDGR
jgi:hypothetical protein